MHGLKRIAIFIVKILIFFYSKVSTKFACHIRFSNKSGLGGKRLHRGPRSGPRVVHKGERFCRSLSVLTEQPKKHLQLTQWIISTKSSIMSDAAAPAKQVKKATKAKQPKAPAAHPPVAQMVNAAITSLKERNGSSLAAIKKYIAGNYKVDMVKIAPFIRRYLKKGVADGKLKQIKGSFKVDKTKVEKPKKAKKPAKKSPKKAAAKPKKAKTPKKKAAAKPKADKPKKVKTPKKKAAAKPKKAKTPAKKAAKPKAKKAKTPKKPAKK